MDIGKISSSFGSNKDIFEELFILSARIIVGFIFSCLIGIWLMNPSIKLLHDSIIFLLTFKASVIFYIALFVFFYIVGVFLVLTYNYLLTFIYQIIFKAYWKTKNKRLFVFYKHLVSYSPLSQYSDEISSDLKKVIGEKLNIYFQLNRKATAQEIEDFSRLISLQNKRVNTYKSTHSVVLYKGLFVNILILIIYFILAHYYLLALIAVFVNLILNRAIKSRYINDSLEFIESAYLIAINKISTDGKD